MFWSFVRILYLNWRATSMIHIRTSLLNNILFFKKILKMKKNKYTRNNLKNKFDHNYLDWEHTSSLSLNVLTY